jgi:putative peptidoglycan lipid II flippase
VLYQRGAFGPDDTAATALALAIYGAGLPAFVLHKVFQPLYYAREDTRSPFRFAVWSMIVNAAIAVGLLPLIGFAAAALATTISGWIMVLQLWLGTRKMGDEARFDDRFRARLPRILLASFIMGGALWVGMILLGPMLGSRGWRFAALGLLVALGMGTYALSALALGAMRLSDLKAALRRQR